jgi:hypothetical protein
LEFHFGDDPVSEAAGSVVVGAKVVVPPAVDGIVTSSTLFTPSPDAGYQLP